VATLHPGGYAASWWLRCILVATLHLCPAIPPAFGKRITLHGVVLHGVVLHGVVLQGVVLQGVVLQGVVLQGVTTRARAH
jgi:uncharacterized protein YjbI with pentapeptide repeats